MKITYEGDVPATPSSYSRAYLTCHGNTKEEIQKDFQYQSQKYPSNTKWWAIGLHNNREDWEECFGKSELADESFGDFW
jgi:hypothetical protein